MRIAPAAHDVRFNRASLSMFAGFGRCITDLSAYGTNFSARSYDHKGRPNEMLKVGFSGNFRVKRLSTGWFGLVVEGKTYRVAPDTEVFFSTESSRGLGVTVTVSTLFDNSYEYASEVPGWERG